MPIIPVMHDRLAAELAATRAELEKHLASWEYAFAMAGGCHGGGAHPVHWATLERGARLRTRCRDLAAQIAEHTPG